MNGVVVGALVLGCAAVACSRKPVSAAEASGSAGFSGATGASSSAGAGGSETDGAADRADDSTDGGPFCTQALGDCAHLSLFGIVADGSFCTLSDGIAVFCDHTPPLWGSGIHHGSTYDYLEWGNGEFWGRLAYDAAGGLVAELTCNAQFAPYWRCVGGLTSFDPSDGASLPIGSGQPIRDICAMDGGPDTR